MEKAVLIILILMVAVVTAYDMYLNYLGAIGISSYMSAFDKASYQLGSLSNTTPFSTVAGLPGMSGPASIGALDPKNFILFTRSPPKTAYNQKSLEEFSAPNSSGTTNAITANVSVKAAAPLQLNELNMLPENGSAKLINYATSILWSLSSIMLSLNPIGGSMAQLPVLDPLLNSSSSIGYWDPLGRLIAVEAALELGISPVSINYTILSSYVNQSRTGRLLGDYVPFSGVPDIQSLSEVYAYSIASQNYADIEGRLFGCEMFSNPNTASSDVTKVHLYGLAFPALNASMPSGTPGITATSALGGASTETILTYQGEMMENLLAASFETNATGFDAVLTGKGANCTIRGSPISQSNYTAYNVSPLQQFYMYSFLQYESDMVSQLFYNKSIQPHIGLIGYYANETLIDMDNLDLANRTPPIIRIDGNEVGYSRYSNFFLINVPLSMGNHTVSFSGSGASAVGTLSIQPYLPITAYLASNSTNSSLALFLPSAMKYPDISKLYNLSLLNASGAIIHDYGNVTVGQSYTIINSTDVAPCAQGSTEAFGLKFGTVYGNSSYVVYVKCS